MPVYEDSTRGAPALVAQIHQPDALDSIAAELDTYFHLLTTLNSQPPTEVFQSLSAISARASEIRHHLVNQDNRRTNAVRTKHIDPLLDEIDRQFRFHSRIQACHQMEWDASRGQT